MRIPHAAALCLSLLAGLAAPVAARAADLVEGIRLFQALDYGAAEAVLTPLADNGDGLAAWYLGQMRDPNFHSTRHGRYYQTEWMDIDAAIRHYERSIELEEPYAWYSLAGLYANNWIQHGITNAGFLSIRLRKQAVPLLERRVAAGDGVAAFMLADLHRQEHGARGYAGTAYRLLLEEALEGRAMSQFYLARAFETHLLFVHEGRGRDNRDLIDAFAWYSVAGIYGEQHAPKHQFTVARQLRFHQFDDAEKATAALLDRLASKKAE